MRNRTVQFLIVGCVLFALVLGCGHGVKKGVIVKLPDGRMKRLEFYDHGVKMVYNFDAFELVESALAYRGESLIAKAERVGMRPREPDCLDMEILEIHFSQTTGDIVYKGKIVFRGRTNVRWAERVEVKSVFGKRPQDLFREWPFAVRY